MRYRNVKTGQVVERPAKDRWLEASKGWVRVTRTRKPAEPAAETTSKGDDDGGS